MLKHNYGLFTLSHKRKMSIHFICQLFSLLCSFFYEATLCNFLFFGGWGGWCRGFAASQMMEKEKKTKRPLWSERIWINTTSECFKQSSSSDLPLHSVSLSWRENEHWAKRLGAGGEPAANDRPMELRPELRNIIFRGRKSRTFNISPQRKQWATGSIICWLCVMERVNDVC